MRNLATVALLGALAVLLSGCGRESERPAVPTLKVGHVGHDHHTALYLAADRAEHYAAQTGILLKPVEDMKLYELLEGGRKLADVEIVRVGGGSKMPTALAQGVIDVGLGGTAPVLAAADAGAPVRLISPLHNRGDMFVLSTDFPARTWEEFVAAARNAEQPVRIGYKSPLACAKLIFEEALRSEGLDFSGDPGRADVHVLMVNVKGGGKLNVALSGGLVDGYAGNNPFPAIGEDLGILRVVCDLEALPPGTFRDHPCCCVAANLEAIRAKREAVEALLVLLLQATETINEDPDAAVDSACRWVGTKPSVERRSIATSDFSMDPSPRWHEQMGLWIGAMNRLGALRAGLAGMPESEVAKLAYDLSLLNRAGARLAQAATRR